MPTAAPVTISGRVLNAAGLGIPRVCVSVTSSTDEVRAVMTSSFGYYRFADVDSGDYIVSVSSKRFTFSQPAMMVSAMDNVTGVDFVASPI